MNHRRAIELLKQAQVFSPAVVPGLAGGGIYILSAMRILGHGETIDEAMDNARSSGNIPDLPPFPAFRGDGKNVTRRGDVIAVANSRTMADRIANALNQYLPNERGI